MDVSKMSVEELLAAQVEVGAALDSKSEIIAGNLVADDVVESVWVEDGAVDEAIYTGAVVAVKGKRVKVLFKDEEEAVYVQAAQIKKATREGKKVDIFAVPEPEPEEAPPADEDE